MGRAVTTEVAFDYSAFSADARGKLIRIAAEIGKQRAVAMKSLMSIAAEVVKAHGVLAAAGCEGRFSAWVESECHFGRSTAYRLIDIHSAFGDFAEVDRIDDQALRRLADANTPEDVVRWAKRRAKGGAFVDLEMVKDRLDEWKQKNVEDDDPATDVEVDEDDADTDDGDGTGLEEDGLDTDVEFGGMDGGGGVGGGEEDVTDDDRHLAPVDFRKWDKLVRQLVNEIDETGIAANTGGDRRERAKEYLRKLDTGWKQACSGR